MAETPGIAPGKKWLYLLIFCAIPFFINLGANALWDNNEAWYAEPPREMAESGRYLVPTYSGFPRFRKPPLTHWIILPFYLLFGVSEFATRLPGAIAVVFTILFTYLIGSRLLHRQAGFMAALILATTPRFFLFGRFFHMDTFLTLFVTAAVYFFLRASERSETHFPLLGYGITALAVLTKGPIGAVVPLAVLTLAAWGTKNRGLRRSLSSPAGIAVFILLTLPWYLFMYAEFGGEFLRIHFFLEHLQRYFTPRLGSKDFTYLFQEWLIGLLPWSLFMLPAVVFVLGRTRELSKASSNQRFTLLPSLWFGFVLLFFSLSTGKREVYLMPLYPAMALTVGQYFTGASYLWRRPYRLAHQAICILLTLVLLGLGLLSRQMLLTLDRSPVEASLPLGLSMLLAGAFAWTLSTDRLDRTGLVLAGTTATLLWTLALALPLIEPYQDVKPLALQVRHQASPSDLVGTYGTHKPSFQFYLGRRPFHACGQQEIEKILHGRRRVFLLASAGAFERLTAQTDIPVQILARGQSLSFRIKYWFDENASPFTHKILAVSRPIDATVWQPDPSRPYLNCRERARGQDHP
ncbi:MAG: ArnT family glycosyltransferase [Candidatus Methylomirabilales bacterium]